MISVPDTTLCRTIWVAPETEGLAEVRRFVEEVGHELGLGIEPVFDLKVAVCEACANAMEHASHASAPVRLCASADGRRLTFIVSDTGVLRPSGPPQDASARRGLGLPLMVALVDEVSFSRVPGGGTTVSLSLLLGPDKTDLA